MYHEHCYLPGLDPIDLTTDARGGNNNDNHAYNAVDDTDECGKNNADCDTDVFVDNDK